MVHQRHSDVPLLDHRISDREQLRRHGYAECFRRLEVDGQFKFGRQEDGISAGFTPFRIRPTMAAAWWPRSATSTPLGHETAGFHAQLKWVDYRHPVLLSQLNDHL